TGCCRAGELEHVAPALWGIAMSVLVTVSARELSGFQRFKACSQSKDLLRQAGHFGRHTLVGFSLPSPRRDTLPSAPLLAGRRLGVFYSPDLEPVAPLQRALYRLGLPMLRGTNRCASLGAKCACGQCSR